MAYLIYDKISTKIVRIMRDGYWQDARFATEAAAKAGLTRLKKAGKYTPDMMIDTVENFAGVEKYEVVISLMSGKPVRQRVNTPRSCDPSTELYWSI